MPYANTYKPSAATANLTEPNLQRSKSRGADVNFQRVGGQPLAGVEDGVRPTGCMSA